MSAVMRWLFKPFINPIDAAIILCYGELAELIGLWAVLVALTLFIASNAVERRYWMTPESRP